MIHRLVNLDYPETPVMRRHVEARQLASRRVTAKPSDRSHEGCRHCVGLPHRLVTTPTRLRPTSESWLNRINLVSA